MNLNDLIKKFKKETPSEIFGLKVNPEALAFITLGNKAFEGDNYSQAITYFTKAIELAPTNRYPLSKRGKCYQMLKDYDKALVDLFKSKELEDNFENNQSIAECYLFKKEFSKAIQYFDIAIQQLEHINAIDTGKMMGLDYDAIKARALNNQANCYYNLKKNREAIEKYNLAISLNPSYSNSIFARGCIYVELEKFEVAFDDFLTFKSLGNSHPGLNDLMSLADSNSSPLLGEFFKQIKIESKDPTNQRDSNIQINAFRQDIEESINEIDFTKSHFSFNDNYQRKVLACKEYFEVLWNTVTGDRRTNGFMGFICLNISKAAELIDPRINSFELFTDLFKMAYKAY